MQYLELLQQLHQSLNPANYLEIGCRHGTSLALARSPALAIDPEPDLSIDITCMMQVFPQTSDKFFGRHDPKLLLGGAIDFAFIDGMHLAEFALRDFANIETHAHRGTVVVVDDVLPSQIEHATRERLTQAWSGDVYRIVPLLRRWRPDLCIEVLDIHMKGACIIWSLTPGGMPRDRLIELENELKEGAHAEPSVARIRQKLCPKSPRTLPSLIRAIQQFRAAENGR